MRGGNGLLLLLLGLVLLSHGAGAKQSGPRPLTNPRTGKPILTPGTVQLSDANLRALLGKVGFPDVEKALGIIKRESGGFADVVVNTVGMTPQELAAYWKTTTGKLDPAGETAVGLFQINVHANTQYTLDAMKDPEANARAAFFLSKGGTDWGPWKQAAA